MARRSLLEKYVDVLAAIDNGKNEPARIMHEARVAGTSRQGILDTLTKNGFVREDERKPSKRYYITPKGKNAVSSLLSVESKVKAR